LTAMVSGSKVSTKPQAGFHIDAQDLVLYSRTTDSSLKSNQTQS